MRSWLVQPIEIEIPRHELLLKLFFGTQVSIDANLEHVRQYRADVDIWLEQLNEGDRLLRAKYGDSDQGVYWLLTVRQGILVEKALRQWCEEAEVALKRMKSKRTGGRDPERRQ